MEHGSNSVLAGLQYRGDANDMQSLYEEYSIGGYLDARRTNAREGGRSRRDEMLKDGVLLNAALSPRIFGIVTAVQKALGVEGEYDVICMNHADVNAFAYVGESEASPERVVGITSAALERLEDAEIAFILGHEFGHMVFGHNRLQGLRNHDEANPSLTVLPYLGECLFLRWQKKAELSADRAGLVAAGAFEPSARALVKAGFGLSEKNLNLDVDVLLGQIESIKDRPEILEAAFRSHPLMPMRLKALRLFSDAFDGTAIAGRDAVEDAIDAVFEWVRRHPRKPVTQAVMQIVACAGLKILGADRHIDDEEVRTLIMVLHYHFTDEPEKQLCLDPGLREKRLREAIAVVNEHGEPSYKDFIISRLADIALADGKLLDDEGSYILETAEALGVPARRAYSTIVAAAQAVGLSEDSRMRDIIRKVKTRLVGQTSKSLCFPPESTRFYG
jgi:hypothetical protein